jgi:hypothetical protein
VGRLERSDALGGDQLDHLRDLGLAVGREAVDRYDARDSVDLADVGQMPAQVDHPVLDGSDVLGAEVGQ